MRRSVGLTEWLRETVPEWAVELFWLVAFLGDWLVLVVILGLVYLADVLWTVRQPKSEPTSPLCSERTMLAIATVFGAILLTLLLKELLALPRPPADLQAVAADDGGFPSGHALIGTVFWAAIVLWTSLGTRRQRLAVAVPVVALVALSRLVLGVHYLADVVVGIAIGLAYVAFVVVALDERPLRAFGVAFVLGVLAVAVTAGGFRAIAGLIATTAAAVGWRVIEHPQVRTGIVAAAVAVGLRPPETEHNP